MESTKVVLDCDFLQGILGNSSVNFFKQLMSELNVKPVVHSYVAEVELQYCSEAKKLIEDGYIEKIEYSQYLLSDYDRELYNEMVWELLDDYGKYDLPPKRHRDVFREGFHYSENSIGEIMSELMAKRMQLPLFASNDGGAKSIANSRINSSKYILEVKNIADLLNDIGVRENGLAWRDVKAVLREKRWHEKREELWHLWNEK